MLNTLHLAFGFYLLGMCASLRASITKAKHAIMCSVGLLAVLVQRLGSCLNLSFLIAC